MLPIWVYSSDDELVVESPPLPEDEAEAMSAEEPNRQKDEAMSAEEPNIPVSSDYFADKEDPLSSDEEKSPSISVQDEDGYSDDYPSGPYKGDLLSMDEEPDEESDEESDEEESPDEGDYAGETPNGTSVAGLRYPSWRYKDRTSCESMLEMALDIQRCLHIGGLTATDDTLLGHLQVLVRNLTDLINQWYTVRGNRRITTTPPHDPYDIIGYGSGGN